MKIYTQIGHKSKFHGQMQYYRKTLVEYLLADEFHLIEDYETQMLVENLSIVTQTKNFQTLLSIFRLFGKKSWKNLQKRDIDLLVANIKRQYSPDDAKTTHNVHDCIKILKIWYRFVKLGDRRYKEVGDPDETKHLRNKKVDDKLAREQLVTTEEMGKLISATKSLRDQALLITHWYLGTRIGETLSIKLKHIKTERDWITIYVDGKTGTRKCRVLEDAKEKLVEWLNHHPTPQDPEAYLWTSHHENARGETLQYEGARAILNKSKELAGIKRRLYFHLFRHTRATISATVYRDSTLKKMFGWSDDSRMVARYTHIIDEDVDNAVREAHGLEKQEDGMWNNSKPKPCIFCSKMITIGAKFCQNCGKPQTKDTAIGEDKTESRLTELEKALNVSQNEIVEMAMNQVMAKIMSDPDGLKKLLKQSKQYKSIK